MSVRMNRRAVLAGLLSGVAGVALAEAPLTSMRPVGRASGAAATPVVARPVEAAVSRMPPRMRPDLAQFIREANLNGTVGVVVADAETGQILEQHEPEIAVPPASVTKSVTALYALDTLGGAFRFVTRVFAVGPIEGGILKGDLILAGGGDPTLSADDLADLAEKLNAAGIVEVQGKFLCWRGALPYAEEIEPSQLDHLGYNPAVSGLNLNYNRVHFEWKRVSGTWQTTMDARTEDRVPSVSMARVRIVDRASPVFRAEAPDQWTVARSALGDGGSRWMPVRQPALYAGDVFRTLARGVGVSLPAPEVIDDLPEPRTELVTHSSDTLRTILQEMMLYSTNLTAEICGLAATQAKYRTSLGIEASAAQMTRWIGETYGVECDFKDHSGLSDANRIGAGAMSKLLLAVAPDNELRPIMRRIAMRDAENNRLEDYPIEVRAKTGTLNFVSALSGYVETVGGTDLVFTIFCADLVRRERGKAAGDEVPAGSIEWNRRAKRLQQQLLQRWGLIYQRREVIEPEIELVSE